MQEQDADLFIKLPARSENLSVVRHAVGNVARQYGMRDEGIADLQIIVTEACSNVVLHAYCDQPRGALEVEANCEASDFGVAVRDYGTGFRAAVAPEAESLRLGLALISTCQSPVMRLTLKVSWPVSPKVARPSTLESVPDAANSGLDAVGAAGELASSQLETKAPIVTAPIRTAIRFAICSPACSGVCSVL